MLKTFSIAKQKEFMATKASEVADDCQNQNLAIIELLCKLTYLKSPQTQNHWIRNLSGIIVKHATDKFKNKKDKFDYNWFFDKCGYVNEDMSKAFFYDLNDKYNDIKPSDKEFDPIRLSRNVADFRKELSDKYSRTKTLLTTEDIKSIITSLDLYKE